MSSAPLTKPGILDVVRKMLKMFILVLCMESLCTSVFGEYALQPLSWIRICSIPPTPAGSCCSLPPACPHPSGTLLSVQLDQSAPIQLSETFGPSGPSPWDKLFLSASTCLHARVVAPLPCRACSRGCGPQVLGSQQSCLTCCS